MISSIIHTVAFHLIILTPSSGPSGNRLNVAKKALMKQINPSNTPIWDQKNI